MEFKKKLRTRLIIAISYIVLGLILVAIDVIGHTDNYFYFSFGIALAVMGILRIIQHRQITKDEKTIRQREVEESDERLWMLSERARSWTFSLSVTIAGIAVIVLSLLGYHEEALPLSWFVCGMVVIYWICYIIISKKY